MEATDTVVEQTTPLPSNDDAAIEAEARTLGWVPREEFRGDPDHWIDAKTFVERGRQMLPILQANNRKLLEQLQATKAELAAVQASLKASQAAIDTLESSRKEDLKDRLDDTIADIKARIRAASEAGDHAAVAELTEKLVEAKQLATNSTLKKSDETPTVAPPPNLPPDIVDWYNRNPQYARDARRAALANAIAIEFRQAGDTTTGVPFLEKVAAEVERTLGGYRPSGPSKVEGSSSSRRSANTPAERSYADLPPEAKQACDRMIPRLVGPGKAYKDVESWRRAYAAQYFKDSE